MANARVPRWVYAPALIGLAVVVVPLLALLPKVEWATFARDISEPATAAALVLSAKSAAIAVIICVLLGVPLALLIARAPERIAGVLRTVVTLPLVLPPLVGGVALLAVLGRTGLIGPWLEQLGIAIPFTPVAVVVAQTFVAMPFLVISVESALRSVGPDYEQIAAGLGASRSRTLFRITLPLIAPGLLAGIVLAFARSVGEFGATALLAGSKPGVTQTIPMAIYTAFNGVGTSRQAAMALSVLLIATALVVLLLFPAARGRSAVRNGAPDLPAGGEPARAVPPVGLQPQVPARGEAVSLDFGFRRAGFELDVGLEIPAGEVLGLVGPNAAGKTTLVNLIAGNLEPSSGTISLADRQVSSADRTVPPAQRNVGVLSQQPLLFPHLSVLENVAFGPRSRGVKAPIARQRARELLGQVGAAGLEHRKPAQLSGGQQQRVALARVLATAPRVLVLDEPLAAMDVSVAPSLRALLAREVARAGMTAVVVTHDLLDVAGLAQRVVVLEHGRVVEDAPVREFLHAPTSGFGAALTGQNILPGPDGTRVHVREEDLVVLRSATGAEAEWSGTVQYVQAAGANARVRIDLGERTVVAAVEYEDAQHLLPGDDVWVGARVTTH